MILVLTDRMCYFQKLWANLLSQCEHQNLKYNSKSWTLFFKKPHQRKKKEKKEKDIWFDPTVGLKLVVPISSLQHIDFPYSSSYSYPWKKRKYLGDNILLSEYVSDPYPDSGGYTLCYTVVLT